MIEPFPIRSPYACRTWPPGLTDLSAPTATFPLHDVTDVFCARPNQPNLSVLVDRCRGKLMFQIAGSTRILGRLPFPRRQVPKEWWSQTGSNRRPHACKARALPTELWPQRVGSGSSVRGEASQGRMAAAPRGARSLRRRMSPPAFEAILTMVGLGRLERPTSPLSGVRSNHLSYRPSTIERFAPRSRYLVRKRNEDGVCPAKGL